jgi:hypothetical protein
VRRPIVLSGAGRPREDSPIEPPAISPRCRYPMALPRGALLVTAADETLERTAQIGARCSLGSARCYVEFGPRCGAVRS